MKKGLKIYVAGHNGMVGSAVWCALEKAGYTNLIGKISTELDLRDQKAVQAFVAKEKPQAIIDAAAKVGGILANSQDQYGFLLQNLQIQNNLIQAAHEHEIAKFIFLGSSCIYPKLAPQPLKEEYLLTGPLEPTNEGYALAKIAGIKLCQAIREQHHKDFVSLMPTNLYGPNDNFDLQSSHVLPAMIRKFHEAKLNKQAPVNLWGSGTPMREFLHVDDMAKAVLFALENKLPEHLYNVGTGTDVTIKRLAETIQKIVGHEGKIQWDSTKPDGTPRKLLDVTKLNELGWKAEIGLEEGVLMTYNWFPKNNLGI
ncbi:GDP-L-fucose synthase [Lutimonas halocynthiae]|uniref:GDP-L-fucose synthase family protein n=1 Tax=Lutimonas halocynthiae TaxID=1446477 RepID=UPI0025B469BF|nr:GDP-L-fucose synthase [Lutimonas halocynthiae]MDN3641805.1 GDP-L-fucose synthase [Lutimonas halocynthiae]